jgi:hypothetical protein
MILGALRMPARPRARVPARTLRSVLKFKSQMRSISRYAMPAEAKVGVRPPI